MCPKICLFLTAVLGLQTQTKMVRFIFFNVCLENKAHVLMAITLLNKLLSSLSLWKETVSMQIIWSLKQLHSISHWNRRTSIMWKESIKEMWGLGTSWVSAPKLLRENGYFLHSFNTSTLKSISTIKMKNIFVQIKILFIKHIHILIFAIVTEQI